MNERQIKYLGLVIEKDGEYDEYVMHNGKEYMIPYEDPVQRQYFPVREKYIRIVKDCRRVCIESQEKRGRKDFKRTYKLLKYVWRAEHEKNKQGPQFWASDRYSVSPSRYTKNFLRSLCVFNFLKVKLILLLISHLFYSFI